MKMMAPATLLLCGLIAASVEVRADALNVVYETVDYADLGRSASNGLPSVTISGTTTGGRIDTNILRVDVANDPNWTAIANYCLASANELLKRGTASELRLYITGSGQSHPGTIPLYVFDGSVDVLRCALLPKKEPKP